MYSVTKPKDLELLSEIVISVVQGVNLGHHSSFWKSLSRRDYLLLRGNCFQSILEWIWFLQLNVVKHLISICILAPLISYWCFQTFLPQNRNSPILLHSSCPVFLSSFKTCCSSSPPISFLALSDIEANFFLLVCVPTWRVSRLLC